MPASHPASLPDGTAVYVLTVSDGVAAGVREDRSGEVIASRLVALGADVRRSVVADDIELIAAAILDAARDHAIVVTTGGTGLTPRDVTPQATRSVLSYEIPGLAEAMRAAGRVSTPLADLSRAVVGVVGRALVINVPGSPAGAAESLAAIEPVLAHAIATLAGPHDHDVARGSGRVAYDPGQESGT
ncbi:MAG: MogA/MoaB family molybdenum cofactor biosynthesis protein [Chloroflexota bacterium]